MSGETGSFAVGVIDVSVLKYAPNGTLLWQKTWGGKDKEAGIGVAVDPWGSIYIAGETLSFGAGLYDAFLLKYAPNGTLLWKRTWGGTKWDNGLGVAVDSSVRIYVTGGTNSPSRTLQDVSGTESTPYGTETTPEGNETTPEGTETEPTGIESTPVGNETYAGGFDVFLLVFTPSPPPVDTTPPTANAGTDLKVTVYTTVSFGSRSSDNVGIVSCEWDFGDGTTGTGGTTTHAYTKPGTYTVTLTVKDAAGNSDTDTMTVTVRPVFPLCALGVVAVASIAAVIVVYLAKVRKTA